MNTSKMFNISILSRVFTRGNACTSKELEAKDPIKYFKKWVNDTQDKKINKLNYKCLATTVKNTKPMSRFIILTPYGQKAFRFYTFNKNQRGVEMDNTPRTAVTVYWKNPNKTIKIQGNYTKIPNSDPSTFFKESSEKKFSVISVRHGQSFPGSHDYLKKETSFSDLTSEKQTCGNYILIPTEIEFWEREQEKINKRIRFRRIGSGENAKELLWGENGWVYELPTS